MTSVLQRARESGRCPPSLLTEDKQDPDGFVMVAARLLDTSGFGLASDPGVVEAFAVALKKATAADAIIDPFQKVAALEQRRCLLLAIAGATNPSSKALERILASGYLSTVKVWLDDTLNGRIGGIDLLLHTLTNIVTLPVTKSQVKSSGMGKAIGNIERHPICKGTPNEAVILARVASVKTAWQASVKARKSQEPSDSMAAIPKTKRESSARASPSSAKRLKAAPAEEAKKPKQDDAKKPKLSALLQKVSSISSITNGSKVPAKLPPRSTVATRPAPQKQVVSDSAAPSKKKASANRVKWADHFGGDLVVSRVIEGDEAVASNEPSPTGSVSWTDRKKRDRAREKELLASVKKVKLLDDEDDQPLPPSGSMKATIRWHVPALLPVRSDVPKPTLTSNEIETQNKRAKVVAPIRYRSDSEVPPDPNPLSEIEQALDMTSQSSAVVESIPFFAPQLQPDAAAAPAPAAPELTAPTAVDLYGADSSTVAAQQTSSVAPAGATAELLQALGLPMFLVGQNVQALQTLASSPGLLSTMVDTHGMFDQTRLLSLVQTLTPGYQEGANTYNSGVDSTLGAFGSAASASTFASSPAAYGGGSSGSNRPSKSDDGNLHVAGYGPGTTQSDIITLFLPYVRVDEVVLKGTFCFVNTSDPDGAQRAREALQGTLLNGMPIRINAAQRKGKEVGAAPFGQTSASAYGPGSGTGENAVPSFGTGTNGVVSEAPSARALATSPTAPAHQQQQTPQHHQPPPPSTQQNVDHVRDDRGNPATKNLFVAGYGQGTSEQQLRDIFNQHAKVVGVVLKGNFSFVNTSTREEAVRAREMLQGQTINGGAVRINFAKETGRLGTSFDLTYNERSGPNALRGANAPSYYGRH